MRRTNKILLGCILFLLLLLTLVKYSVFGREGFENSSHIIGYIHVCQKEGWKRSFDYLWKAITESGLYDATHKIRVGIVSESGILYPDKRFEDSKIEIIHIGKNNEYERPTLLHMRKNSETDPLNTYYYYLHTKGIKHWGTKWDSAITSWIHSMLDWNIYKWKSVVEKLKEYETYGIHWKELHYSGNFWWARSDHIQKLSKTIPSYYTAPEDWILTNKDNMYCAFNCGKDFVIPYPAGVY
jgi:hypothetical protein